MEFKGVLPWPASAKTEAGFRICQTYALTYTQEFDEVLVQIPHAPGRTAKLMSEEFKKCFRK